MLQWDQFNANFDLTWYFALYTTLCCIANRLYILINMADVCRFGTLKFSGLWIHHWEPKIRV